MDDSEVGIGKPDRNLFNPVVRYIKRGVDGEIVVYHQGNFSIMTTTIGQHYSGVDQQRVHPVEMGDEWYDIYANRFDDRWFVEQSLPDSSTIDSIDDLHQSVQQCLDEIEALQMAGYEFQMCEDGAVFWVSDES